MVCLHAALCPSEKVEGHGKNKALEVDLIYSNPFSQ
jgi:hypothetical protein